MATKVKTGVIDSSAITSALIANASITADDLHTTLDLTGKTVTVATASAGDNDTSVASTAFVSTAIANLADSAPSTLNTLNELAAALGDDANYATTTTNAIAAKAPLASPSLTGTVTVTGASSAYNTLQLTSNSTGHGTVINLGDTSDADYGSITQFASSAGEGGRMRFIAGTTETMNLRGGKVGIGTNNPAAAKLDIVSADNSNTIAVVNIQNNMDNSREALRITSLGDYDAHMSFYAAGSTSYWGGFGIDYSDAGKFKLQTDNILSNGTNLMTWARDNKVGIGTVNPSAHLHIDVATPTIKLGGYSFITEDVGDVDSLGLWTHTTESILFGQTANNLTSHNITCRIDNNGILRPTRFRLPASALPTSALSVGELHVDTGDSNKVKVYDGSAWVSLNNATLGESGNPAADGAALLAASAANGAYYFDHDGTEYQTYYIGDVLGGGWQLAMCVTNGADSGDTVAEALGSATGRTDWFNGDTTVGSGNTGVSATGTNWFTASNSNELNVTSMTGLNKTNSRGRGFFKSFTNMMIRQNIGGTVGYRSYVLNASNSLYSWFQIADHTGFTNRTSSSSTAGSGVTTNNSTAIRLSNIDFNYQLSNDGGRIVTSGSVSSESSGGIGCRVDGHRGYAWTGNVVNDYTARSYSLDGTIDDHTLWIFVK